MSPTMVQTILVIDDQHAARRLLYHVLKDDYRLLEAADGHAALDTLRKEPIDLVLLDLHLPPDVQTATEGIRVQRLIAEQAPHVPVVVITGDQDRSLALEMVRRSVADFLLKPVAPDVLKIVVARALERARLEAELRELREQVRERYSFGGLVGQSAAMRAVFAKLERLAAARTTVLLLGESGTGKSALARALHEASPRSAGTFVVVDGAAIAESLVESELFGHARGAFTGAEAARKGRLAAADGGTLFLDEIGNLSLAVQSKLLLFLDDRSFSPVGSGERVQVDVRLVAATNRDLERLVAEGKFREDLLFRLQVATVLLPPLRERREDIAPLSEFLLAALAREMGLPPLRLTPAAAAALAAHAWPGNVRQLKHVLESSLALARGNSLDVEDLVLPAHAGAEDPTTGGSAPQAAELAPSGSLKDRLAAFEHRELLAAVHNCQGNKAAAGRLLGLDENQIRYLCRKHGLS